MLEKSLSKRELEKIIQNSIKKYGFFKTSILLESLKSLGFYYATTSGLSINIEDLKSPIEKDNILKNINLDLHKISKLWQNGCVTQIERFKKIMDDWTIASEILKLEILSSYEQSNLTNNLFIMAASGARGNISQVRQVIGIRGLMSDQEGNIIDVPIATNFREGLTSIDYFISSYGARKGIVDTALKTADAGYLTRRLIYVTQDLVIRERFCADKMGLTSILDKYGIKSNFIGQSILSYYTKNRLKQKIFKSNNILTEDLFNIIKQEINENSFLYLNTRSVLTCKLYNSICQACYGWDLAKKELVALGTTIGIIAAQSIGEPGTQLTMRTFHTGGVYSGTVEGDIKTPISGKITNLNTLKWEYGRTKYGNIAKQLLKNTILNIIDFNNIKYIISLNKDSLIYLNLKKYIIKDQSIAESSFDINSNNKKKFREIYPNFEGEIFFENNEKNKKQNTQFLAKDHRLCIGANKLLYLKKNALYLDPFQITSKKAIAMLKIVSPIFGISEILDNNIYIHSILDKVKQSTLFDYSYQFKSQNDLEHIHQKISNILNTNLISTSLNLDLNSIDQDFSEYIIKIVPLINSYQWIYPSTTIAHIYIHLKTDEKNTVYNIKKNKRKNDFIINLKKDNSCIFKNYLNYFSNISKKINIYNSSNFYNLKNDGFSQISQKLEYIVLNKGSFINNTYNRFAFPNSVIGITINYKKKANDIVQGLPKVENIIEAREYSKFAVLAESPSIFLGSDQNNLIEVNNNNFFSNIRCEGKIEKKLETKKIAQTINIAYNGFRNKNLCLYKNKFYIYRLKEEIPNIINSKIKITPIYKINTSKKNIWLNVVKEYLLPDSNILYVMTENNIGLELKPMNVIYTKNIKTFHKLIKKAGDYLDICEPITTGILSPKEFLRILYGYYFSLFGTQEGYIKTVTKFQILAINSIYAIYKSQGVDISLKHIEIVIKQLTSKATIINSGDSPLISNEKISSNLANHIFEILKSYTPNNVQYAPSFVAASKYSLNKEGFLTNAGFQETKQVLIKSSLHGTKDWLKTLKAAIIAGKLSQIGTNIFNHTHYLDFIYKYKHYDSFKKNKK